MSCNQFPTTTTSLLHATPASSSSGHGHRRHLLGVVALRFSNFFVTKFLFLTPTS